MFRKFCVVFQKYCVVFQKYCVLFQKYCVLFQELFVVFADMGHRTFVTGLVSAAVTDVTMIWVNQLVDIVGAAVLYLNEDPFIATANNVNAGFSCDCTLSHCRMIFTQPGRELCITSVPRWTCDRHFCARSSLEAIPAIECVVTFVVYCYVVLFSFCIGQILVILTPIN